MASGGRLFFLVLQYMVSINLILEKKALVELIVTGVLSIHTVFSRHSMKKICFGVPLLQQFHGLGLCSHLSLCFWGF